MHDLLLTCRTYLRPGVTDSRVRTTRRPFCAQCAPGGLRARVVVIYWTSYNFGWDCSSPRTGHTHSQPPPPSSTPLPVKLVEARASFDSCSFRFWDMHCPYELVMRERLATNRARTISADRQQSGGFLSFLTGELTKQAL